MRINQLIQAYGNASLQSRFSLTSNDATTPALSGAKRANQARLSDAAKGFTQAAKVRDGAVKVRDNVSKAEVAVNQALKPGASVDEKRVLQAELTKALDAVDLGVKDQQNALVDNTLTNKTYDTKRVAVSEAVKIGANASDSFSSLKDLRNLDVNTASEAQLSEAAKVLAAARTQTTNEATAADKQVDSISGKVNLLDNVQRALEGSSTTTKEQRELQVVQQLLSSTLITGSLFNSTV